LFSKTFLIITCGTPSDRQSPEFPDPAEFGVSNARGCKGMFLTRTHTSAVPQNILNQTMDFHGKTFAPL
jgi:hypothetical protein